MRDTRDHIDGLVGIRLRKRQLNFLRTCKTLLYMFGTPHKLFLDFLLILLAEIKLYFVIFSIRQL